MIYDLSKPLDAERFAARARFLSEKQRMVELTDVSRRSLNQNRYLHICLTYFGNEIGESMEYVKETYFKRMCNCDIFVYKQADKVTGEETERVRSTREISREDMTVAIERFRKFASDNGCYIPSSEEHEYLRQMEYENERMRVWQ